MKIGEFNLCMSSISVVFVWLSTYSAVAVSPRLIMFSSTHGARARAAPDCSISAIPVEKLPTHQAVFLWMTICKNEKDHEYYALMQCVWFRLRSTLSWSAQITKYTGEINRGSDVDDVMLLEQLWIPLSKRLMLGISNSQSRESYSSVFLPWGLFALVEK